MKMSSKNPSQESWTSQQGSTLIETVIALLILMVGVLGVMGVLTFALVQSWNQGDRSTRTTEYAQDKMEQLMALDFNDGTSNTTQYPTQSTGGTGLGGVMSGSTTVGGVTSGSPVTNYVDYINSSGSLQSTSTGALYIRQWSITTNATANLKTITVVVRARIATATGGATPVTTLVTMKSR